MGNCVHCLNSTIPALIPIKISIYGTSSQIILGEILGCPIGDVEQSYTFGKELGSGQFGVTHICTHKLSGKVYACKTIPKHKLSYKESIDDVRREVEIMQKVKGHPNIVELKEVFEDKKCIHLVMELCKGGELLERIAMKGKYTERGAASLFQSIIRAIHTCHSLGIIHRDIKPENFIFLNEDEDSPLKMIDFGLAVSFSSQDEVFKDRVGSEYYIAPEVIRQCYGKEADVWSAGIILYILLCGMPPFYADNEEGTLNAILNQKVDLINYPWSSISNGAKELVSMILTKDPKERPTTQDILNHKWVQIDMDVPDKPLDKVVLTRMKRFRAMNQFKKHAMHVIAQRLSEDEIKDLKEAFKSMDVDNNGIITFEELKERLAKQGSKLAESEIKQLIESIDVDGDGHIDYMEFITATMNLNKINQEEHLIVAFKHYDKDNSGYITLDELEEALRENNMGDEFMIKQTIEQVDLDKDGKINYEEFVAMMKGSAPKQKHC